MSNTPTTGMGSGYFKSNPPFNYPDRNIKFLDAQRALDQNSGVPTFGNVTKRNFTIQRGYMRNLQPATIKNIEINKCYFQFNPQEIRQNVQMREDIYNPILLTAEQLSQPIGGNVNFQFDLFFDRSHELSANQKGPLAQYTSENFEVANNPAGKGADQIGVYADLKVLYNIIGQGLSEQTIDLQLEMLKNTYNAKVKRDAAYSSNSETTTGTTDTPTESSTVEVEGNPYDKDFTDKEALRALFDSNIGNAAFLLPNPVRIVFSPLLMVDGFVTSTSVDFLKFNNDMIPMQCRVAMSVNALYIGFAKKPTFLSTTLETGRTAAFEEQAADKLSIKPIDQVLSSDPVIRPFRMVFGSTELNPGTLGFDWDDVVQNGDIQGCNLYPYLMPNDVIDRLDDGLRFRIAFMGFPGIKPKAGGGKDVDPILALFEDPNANFTISYSWEFKIYGKPNQNSANGVGWTYAEAIGMAGSGKYKSTEFAELVGNYGETLSASSKKEWGSGTTGSGRDYDRIRRKYYNGNDKLPNSNSYDLDFSTATRRNNIKASYYVVAYSFTLTASAGSQTRTYGMSDAKSFVAATKGDGKTGVDARNPSTTTSVMFTKLTSG